MWSLMRAVSRAADYIDDNDDGDEGGGDKGSLAEPPTAPFTIRTLPFVDDWLDSDDAEGEVMMFTRMMGKESISWGP